MKRTLHARNEAGITLIELMIAVAIVAVLAIIGVVGYTKYIKSARLIEARDLMGKIQMAQETYYQRVGSYCNATGSASWHPTLPTGFELRPWGTPSGTWISCFGTKAQPEKSQTYFSYQVVAGIGGHSGISSALGIQTGMPWYYILARADMDGDGTDYTEFRVHSQRRDIWVINEGQ